MPSVTIPLVGNLTHRLQDSGGGTKDQLFNNCFPVAFKNSVTGVNQVFIEKRGGFVAQTTPSSGNYNNELIYDPTMGLVSAFSAILTDTADSTVYVGTTSVGVSSDRVRKMTSIKLGSTAYVMISTYGTTAWYLASDSYSTTTYTADGNNSTTLTDVKISGVNSVAGLYVGQKLSAASNIAAGSRIVSIDPATFTVVLDTATTGGAFNDLSITKEPLAKIIDADLPTDIVSRFVEMDGFVYFLTSSGRLYNFDLNSVTSITAGNYITCNQSGDEGTALERLGDYIVSWGANSMELFRNEGNPSGSPLSRVKGPFINIGAFDQDAVSKISGSVYWVTRASDGSNRIFMMNSSLQPQEITDFGIQRWLSGTSSFDRYHVSGSHFFGGTYIFVSRWQADAVFCFVYCVDTGIWVQVESSYVFNFCSDISLSGAAFQYSASKATTDGKIYLWSVTDYRDNGTAITMQVRTSKTDFETDNLKTIKSVSLMGSDIQTSGTVTLEYNDSDYNSGSWVTAGTFDLTKINPRIFRCGSFRGGRAWRLTQNTNVPFRAQALKFEYEIGSH